MIYFLVSLFTPKRRYSFEDKRREMQSRRIKAIEEIANEHLAKARLGGPGFKVKKEVLISYEDLLRIWDLSDKIWMDL